MRPVIEALRRRGDEVLVTARDFAQTLGLLERFRLDHTAIGHHRGGKLAAKGVGLALALGRARALGERPADRSRARPRLQRRLGRREAAADPVRHRVRLRVGAPAAPHQLPARDPRSSSRTRSRPSGSTPYGATLAKLRRYEGLKEEYYLADFEPDPAVLAELGLDRARPLAVVRTPPAVSLYHRFEAPVFTQVLERLHGRAGRRAPAHATSSARSWRAAGGFIVPEQAIDAQSLVAFADLVISAGGTMNREAVALGTPVWTTFEGRLGAVDERADRRRPAAPADARRGRRVRAPGRRRTEPPRACAATPRCSPISS